MWMQYIFVKLQDLVYRQNQSWPDNLEFKSLLIGMLQSDRAEREARPLADSEMHQELVWMQSPLVNPQGRLKEEILLSVTGTLPVLLSLLGWIAATSAFWKVWSVWNVIAGSLNNVSCGEHRLGNLETMGNSWFSLFKEMNIIKCSVFNSVTKTRENCTR